MIWIYERTQEHTTKMFLPNLKKKSLIHNSNICAGITYIVGNTQVYDSVMADVMKKIATQKRQNMSTHWKGRKITSLCNIHIQQITTDCCVLCGCQHVKECLPYLPWL